ncbi:related to papaya ringspot virus polyprotein [Phialocephala subalpina]|uniref:Related to papaya ringspot virus polyprotein n=1 Tax=Phialocephala subalpina TaxID=576137 RepID=A0A1L7WBR2_9HELO|nr:related to papaya ringspot virus polyprotein [Phialocephala subalpina]
MPVNNSGRIVKTRNVKKGTAHQKNHRWESFTTKISKLSALDPIRRVRRHDIDAEDLSTSTSYLKAGLEKWLDLNMSDTFATFARDISQMCDSLPQIIHFEDKIMDTFVAYMEKREKSSLEPLLELITDFAHDLGARFEKHYPKTLEIVTSIAGTPQDVEVIEWSFTCLAFLFKYLSKLLVPDLRPTYDLMAPLLGKHHQRPHIARFAAEAMSFLVKKAAAPAHREKSLPLIVAHAKEDLESIRETKEFGLYYHGIMTLFAEAMKGNGLTVHTSGPAIFQCLVDTLADVDMASKESSPWTDVICGVLTSIIHHTSSDAFKDVQNVVLTHVSVIIDSSKESPVEPKLQCSLFSAKLLGIIAGVRKGSRVSDWPALLQNMARILCLLSTNSKIIAAKAEEINIWQSVIVSAAIMIQYAPMDTLITFVSPFMEALTKDPLAPWFLTFCSFLSEGEPERFQSVALPYFRRFVVAHWSDADNGDTLSVLLPKMVSTGVLPSRYSKDGFSLPQSWQDQIVSKFERLEVSPFPEQSSPYDRSPATWHDRCLPKYNALLEVLDSTVVHPSTNARIAEILLRKLKLALRPSSSLAQEEANFIVGRGFSAFSRMSKAAGEIDRALEPLLRAAAPRYARLPNFLEAFLGYETSLKASPTQKGESPSKESGSDADSDLLVTSLVSNLSTSSHELRMLSLRLLDYIYTADRCSKSEALTVMLMVEQTPLDLQTARSASMHIRKLATLFPSQDSAPWLKDAIAAFCFGMLTVKFAQIWDDATSSLKQIAESKEGEEIVGKIAFEWLETSSVAWDGAGTSVEQNSSNGLTDFECSNMMRLEQVAKESESGVLGARDTMLKKFAEAQDLVAAKPSSARAQALRVLSAVPTAAGKRSRSFVPMFLSWAGKQDENGLASEDEDATLSDWTRKDQKAQLDIFAQFTNPKSLYKADEVHTALLALVANGDIEIQKSAVKALFTRKDPSIKPYEENLMNLLDEARFKDEIAILLQGQTLIQPEHRDALMPLLLRLLYGRSISRKGAASGRQGMEARRLTILRSLSVTDMGTFLDIALGELQDAKVIDNGQFQEAVLDREILSVRKQVGFIHMMEGMLKELATKAIPYAQKLVDAVLYCTIFACRHLQDEAEEIDVETPQNNQTSLLKVVRQTGLKCLNLLFINTPDFEWMPYIKVIDKEIISPRLTNLPIETAQGVSAVLRLFSAWSASAKLVLFLGVNDQILAKVAECLTPPKSKDEVKLFALSILKNVVKLCQESAENPTSDRVRDELLTPNMDHFLIHIGGVLRGDPSKNLLESCVGTVSELAPFVTTSTQAKNLVEVSIFLLDQPTRRVSPKTKSGLLLVLENFVPLYELHKDHELKDKVYHTITSLFGFFKDRTSREVLSRVLLVYSEQDPILKDVAQLCVDLNSFVEGRLDEPDYDRRRNAFSIIEAPRTPSFTARQWTPLLYNMLYYIRHDEEFAILSSHSSDGICTFLKSAAEAEDDAEKAAFLNMLSTILIPALFAGAREPSEVVRREYLKVMSSLVRLFPDWTDVSDMHSLLAGDDELESSFFNNILAVGVGRRSSALGQVSAAAERGELNAKNISQFFIPVIEHFIFDREEGSSDAHNLAAEATTAVAVLAKSLEWPQYRALLRRFIGYISSKPELEKQIIRLLGKIIDSLADCVSENLVEEEAMDADKPNKTRSTLAATIPSQQKLGDDLCSNIIPPLTAYLHDKDESTVSLRVPVAVIVVRLLKLLPEEKLRERLPAVLTDVCHILRSKAQTSRDMTRDTLVKICVLLGPSTFGFVLKELRSALATGSQIHVLSYTMHSILVACIPEYAPGDLDYCLPSIVSIIMDDIFGAAGQEKDAEEYTSKMKEVKSSKSYDSMELVARTATLSRLTDLVKPIRLLLKEKLNLKMVRKIDELLNRIANGLLRNSAADSRDSLIFCYEVIQDVHNGKKPKEAAPVDRKLKKYLLQKGAKRAGERGGTSIYTHKLVRFAFDVLRSVLKKYDSLRTGNNIAGFIPILGDAVVQAEDEVKVAAFRLLVTLVKVPLKNSTEGTDLYRIAAAEARRAISANSSTASDISQAALKLISVILRDRQDVLVKETAVDELLTRLKDDITEPERRHVTFNFLRAVLDSKVETAVVYDTLDYVGTVMVTNDDKDTRDLARGAYFQFLRDYPQTKKRWSKQLDFITANLTYEREGGRLSILEVIHLLLSKSSDDYVQEVARRCFLPLIFTLADESEKCRLSAGEVIKSIFKKADRERTTNFLTSLRSWVNSPKPNVVYITLQTYGFYYESQTTDDSDVSMLLERISEILQTAQDPDSDWQQIYGALELALILVQNFPEVLLSSKNKAFWTAIRAGLSFPNAWVKLSAAKITSAYFTDFARANAESGLENLPLKGSHGLKLKGVDITDLIRRVAHIFKTPNLLQPLADEVVKNLVFLGRVAGSTDLKWKSTQDMELDGEDEDEEDEDEEKDERTALEYLFGRLSFILRREITPPPRAPMLIPKSAALQLVSLLASKLEPASLTPCLQTILLPLHNLTDPSIPAPFSTDEDFRTGYEALKSSSEEIMEGLKKKMGTATYTEALLKVREGVKERRLKRNSKRKIEAVKEPERYGEVKRRKGERKRERRKEKGAEYRSKRHEY